MSPLRMRMIEDMTLAGLAPGTQATYIQLRSRSCQIAHILNLGWWHEASSYQPVCEKIGNPQHSVHHQFVER
jgi:hypothetical protein